MSRGCLKERRKGVWSLVVYLGKQNGKKTYKTFTIYGTQKEAEKERTKRLGELDAGKLSAPQKDTLADYLARYQQIKAPQWSPATRSGKEMLIRLYILPTLGAYRLDKITPLDIETAVSEWRRMNVRGHALAESTVRRIFTMLKVALNQAVEWEIIARSPCAKVTLGQLTEQPRPALDADSGAQLLEAAHGTRLYLPILFALATGLRRGEILGLRWSDLNPELTRLTIYQAVYQAGGEIGYSAAKTKRSHRTLPLPGVLTEALTTHKEEQAKVRRTWTNAGLDLGEWARGLIFSREDGSCWRPTNFSSDFSELAEKIGLKGFTFHDLRHSHVSQLIAAGIDLKVVSERVGHTNISITGNRYAHVFPGAQQTASDKIDEMMRAAIERRRAQGE